MRIFKRPPRVNPETGQPMSNELPIVWVIMLGILVLPLFFMTITGHGTAVWNLFMMIFEFTMLFIVPPVILLLARKGVLEEASAKILAILLVIASAITWIIWLVPRD